MGIEDGREPKENVSRETREAEATIAFLEADRDEYCVNGHLQCSNKPGGTCADELRSRMMEKTGDPNWITEPEIAKSHSTTVAEIELAVRVSDRRALFSAALDRAEREAGDGHFWPGSMGEAARSLIGDAFPDRDQPGMMLTTLDCREPREHGSSLLEIKADVVAEHRVNFMKDTLDIWDTGEWTRNEPIAQALMQRLAERIGTEIGLDLEFATITVAALDNRDTFEFGDDGEPKNERALSI